MLIINKIWLKVYDALYILFWGFSLRSCNNAYQAFRNLGSRTEIRPQKPCDGSRSFEVIKLTWWLKSFVFGIGIFQGAQTKYNFFFVRVTRRWIWEAGRKGIKIFGREKKVSSSIVSNGRVSRKESERFWEEVVVSLLMGYPDIWLQVLEKQRQISVNIVDVPAEIRVVYLQNVALFLYQRARPYFTILHVWS
jgi:hypothetical protein